MSSPEKDAQVATLQLLNPPESLQKEIKTMPAQREAASLLEAKNDGPLFSDVLEKNKDRWSENPNDLEPQLKAAQDFIASKKKSSTRLEVARRCLQNPEDIFCLAYKERWTPDRSNKKQKPAPISKAAVIQHLKNKDFLKLESASLRQILPGIRKLSTATMRDVSLDAINQQQCFSENIYQGLASMLEDDFPDEEPVKLTLGLLDKLKQCSQGETQQKAIYRLAMLYVWKNQCSQAIPLFDLQLKSADAKFLQTRSRYWQDWCIKKESTADAKTPAPTTQVADLPQTFHALVSDGSIDNKIQNWFSSNSDPIVQYRSDSNKSLNAILDVADLMIRIGEKQEAFYLLEGVKTDQMDLESENVLLYISIVGYRVQYGIITFQALTRAFDKNPKTKTALTLKTYYPGWYLEAAELQKEKVDPYLLLSLVRQESAFNPKAKSPAGARGLMQLLPRTARAFGRVSKNDLFVAEKNLTVGSKFLAYLINRYNGQAHLALAAYNAGPSAVDDWMKRYPTDNALLFMDLVPYRETREYVSSILRNWYWYNKLYNDRKQSHQNRTQKNVAKLSHKKTSQIRQVASAMNSASHR